MLVSRKKPISLALDSRETLPSSVLFLKMNFIYQIQNMKKYILDGEISLGRHTNGKILRNWRRNSILHYDEVYGDTTYLSLIKNFKELGFLEDADNCYYFHRTRRRQNLTFLYNLIDKMMEAFCGYGVKPVYPLICSMVILLFI